MPLGPGIGVRGLTRHPPALGPGANAALDGPFEKIAGIAKAPTGKVTNATAAAGFLLSHRVNDAFVAVNRLLAAGG